MLAKIWLLEKENKALSDEKLALKLENSEIKEILIKDVYGNNENKKQISQPGMEKLKESTHMEEQKKSDFEDRSRGEQKEKLTEKDRPWGADVNDKQEWSNG
eukprot:Seg10649.1 transcript_id=Seg10649.1/GoldUCD/mRNA.D3Y31 product="hypothetical protein" protein_id=Seg10649.1/GoldUCD/D3Y31